MRDTVTIGMGHTSLHHKIDCFFASRGLGVNPYMLRRSRLRAIIALELSSDEELETLGIARAEILPHVFADLLS